MRFITYNYTQQSETVVTYSSQNTQYPASNIKNEFRAKEWRSSGYFKITTSNNVINFTEGVTTYNTTLTVGEYNTTDLAAAIQSKLSTTGAYSYTVTYNENTGIWSIESSSEATLNNNVSNNVFYNVLGFNNAVITGIEFEGVRSAIHTEEYLSFDLKTTEEINSVVLMWSQGQYKLSSDAVLRVQASATSNFDSPAIDEVLEFDNENELASHYFTSSQSYRFWRIKIIDPANVYAYVSLGVIVLGQHEVVSNLDNGFIFNQTDNSNITRTDYGQEYVDIYPTLKSISFEMSYIDYDEVELLMSIFTRVGNKTPIFIVVDETDLVFNKNCFAIYGKLPSSFQQKHSFYKTFNTSISIREIN